jgi:hypothetical protein
MKRKSSKLTVKFALKFTKKLKKRKSNNDNFEKIEKKIVELANELEMELKELDNYGKN